MKINRKKIEKEAEKMGIKMIILFGSQAEGKARPDSDYDVAVLTTPERNIKNSMKIYTDILFFLSDALDIPDQKLDLTNLNNANPLLKYQIFSDGKLLYGSEYLYCERRAGAYREYIDAQPLFKLEEKIIKKRQQMLEKATAKL